MTSKNIRNNIDKLANRLSKLYDINFVVSSSTSGDYRKISNIDFNHNDRLMDIRITPTLNANGYVKNVVDFDIYDTARRTLLFQDQVIQAT